MTFLLGNLRIKLLALGLASALWGVVAYTQNPIQTKSVLISIDKPNLPADMLILETKPAYVKVVGPAGTLKNFDVRSLQFHADFSAVKVGWNRVQVSADSADSAVTVQQADPLLVNVDQAASVEQAVKLERVHSLPAGFHEVLTGTSITPEKVVIQGPKSQLAGIEAELRRRGG